MVGIPRFTTPNQEKEFFGNDAVYGFGIKAVSGAKNVHTGKNPTFYPVVLKIEEKSQNLDISYFIHNFYRVR